jgi:hypothetical protein
MSVEGLRPDDGYFGTYAKAVPAPEWPVRRKSARKISGLGSAPTDHSLDSLPDQPKAKAEASSKDVFTIPVQRRS